MINNEPRPVVIACHQALQDELKIRQEEMFKETKRKTKGGITTFSKIAAWELSLIRQSGNEIKAEIDSINSEKEIKVIDGQEFVPFHLYKKLLILTSILNKRKDTNQIILDIQKPRGSKKNEINFGW